MMLRQGWSLEKVRQNQIHYASDLLPAGVTWKPLAPADRSQVEQMVRDHISGSTGYTFDQVSGGVVALDQAEQIICGLVADGATFTGRTVLFLRHLVVDPAWRRRGVGTVTLGVLPQLLGTPPALTLGGCAETAARFYQRAGFTVLAKGAPMPFPYGTAPALWNSNPAYPCWFFWEW